MGKTALFLTVFLAIPAWGQAIRFEHTVLFVKLKTGQAQLQHPLVLSKKKLFGNLYELGTSDAILLENDLLRHESVDWVEKSFISEGSGREELAPNVQKSARGADHGFDDTFASALWGFRGQDKNGISVEEAYQNLPNWAATPVIVAVIDSGVDYRHVDLRNSMWVNEDEVPSNGIDDDQNGYVDDIHGIDVLNNDSDPAPTHFHGTHVAGTIAAGQNNRLGVAGVSSHAKIMAIRTVPDETNESDRDVITSFLYAANNGAKVVNCSFGKYRQGRAVKETINHLGARGVLVVAAAGNDSRGEDNRWFNIDRRGHYPSSFDSDSMLVVTATKENGALADFSNIGKRNVDVAAPGDSIYSTTPHNRYGNSSGTSMATPMVSGIAAQLLAYYPQLTPLEVKEIIMKSAVPVDALRGKVRSGGRADLAQAMEYALVNFSHRR